MSSWVINASPLILLGKIDRLALLEALQPNFVIPVSVKLEVLAGPTGDVARDWIQTGRIQKRVINDAIPHVSVLAWDLGAGETAVISWALANPGAWSVLDDLAARTCAQIFGVPVLGTLGILLRAKRVGLITTLRPELEHLLQAGSLLSSALIDEALRLAGELPDF